jgi:hypothetical protein
MNDTSESQPGCSGAGLGIHWPMDWPMDPRRPALLSAIPQATMILLAAPS